MNIILTDSRGGQILSRGDKMNKGAGPNTMSVRQCWPVLVNDWGATGWNGQQRPSDRKT